MNDPRADDRQFRRGMVLGLTLAEVLLLLTFVLMLILAARLITLHHQLAAERLHNSVAGKELSALLPLVRQLQTRAKFDITKEWVRLKSELADAKNELAANKDAIALVEKRRLAEHGRSRKEIVDEIEQESEHGRRFVSDAIALAPKAKLAEALDAYENYARTGKLVADNGGKSRDWAAQTATCRQSLTTCTAQNKNLSARLGGVLPPCWVDTSGRPQYIFDARLREDGIVLVDNHVAGREADQSLLPLTGFKFGSPMAAAALDQAGVSLLRFSENKNCRFYVRVFDQTESASKVRYKELLKAVEGIFYKLLVT